MIKKRRYPNLYKKVPLEVRKVSKVQKPINIFIGWKSHFILFQLFHNNFRLFHSWLKCQGPKQPSSYILKSPSDQPTSHFFISTSCKAGSPTTMMQDKGKGIEVWWRTWRVFTIFLFDSVCLSSLYSSPCKELENRQACQTTQGWKNFAFRLLISGLNKTSEEMGVHVSYAVIYAL